MSDEYSEEPYEEPAEKTEPPSAEPRLAAPTPETELNEVTVRAWPKMILFYPTMILSLVLAVISYTIAVNPLLLPLRDSLLAVIGFVWFMIFTFNLLVTSFEFGRGITVALVLTLIIIILIIAIVAFVTGSVPWINPMVFGLVMWPSTLMGFFLIFGFITILAWIETRLHYFRITPNEMYMKRGILGDVDRYSTTNVMVHKEIRDVFEFLMFRSGRLTITIPGRKTAIVLDNVPRINKVERQILYLLRRIEIDID